MSLNLRDALEPPPEQFEVELSGLIFRGRPPTAPDWARAQARVNETVNASARLGAARARYGLEPGEQAALVDPDNWAGLAEWMLLAELGHIVGEAIVANGTEFAPTVQNCAEMIRSRTNHQLFMNAVAKADMALTRPKASAARSGDGTSPAA